MAWVKVYEEVSSHHKTARLAQGLEISLAAAVGHLVLLWLFAVKNAWRDGDLALWGDAAIERAACWEGEKGAFVKVLREVGWLDRSAVHDWLDIAGPYIYQREANEAAVKAKQAKLKKPPIKNSVVNGLKPDSDKIRVDKKEQSIAQPELIVTEVLGTITAALPVPVVEKPLEPEKPKERTPLQRIMRAYKVAKSIPPDDAGWDKHNYAQYVRAAVKLLEAFDQNIEAAMIFMLAKGEEWDEQNLPDWTLHAIAKHAWDHRGKTLAAQLGGPDAPRTDEGRRTGSEGLGGRDQEQVGSDSILGPGSTRRIASSREVAGEVIKELGPEPGQP